MSTRIKTFDCVEMKRKAQRNLHEEYEARQSEFSSYFAFLEARTHESLRQREFWAKIRGSPTKAGN